MARSNLEIIREAGKALNRGDVETVVALTDPDVVFEPLRAPVSGAYVGHDGMRQYMADTAETFETFHLETKEIRDLGDDRLLIFGTMRARARLGGLETEVNSAGIATFRDGRLIHWKDYGEDRDAALEAAERRA